MAKQWVVIAHPDYFISFRNIVNNPDDRFRVTTGIREHLKDVDDPREDLESSPGEMDQFEFGVLEYTIIVQWKEEFLNNIKLLEIYQIEDEDHEE